MKNKLKKTFSRSKNDEAKNEAPSRITNETMSVHREEILDSGRKYIYPLGHSKHRLVVLSITLLLVTLVVFFTYCLLALYKLNNTSTFMHRVTQVVPFPVARIGSDFVSYENYLFEIGHYTHYYKTQQQLDFNSDAGKQQLAEFKKKALEKVVNDAYIKQVAKERSISVSGEEIDAEIEVVRAQNRLGGNEKEFENVLRDFWNWSIDDFKRSLKQQILEQKVISALDTEAHDKANNAYAQLQGGKDFDKLAKEVSEDPSTKNNGGEFGFLIDKANRDISPKTIDALFKLEPGQYSGVIDVGYGLEILKNIEKRGDKIQAAHIVFNFKDITTYLNDIKDQKAARTYINL